MSFRSRLRLFFVLIVVLPVAAMAAVVFPLTEGSENGKADAGLAVALDVAASLYGDGRAAAKDDLRRIAGDGELQAALRAQNEQAVGTRIRELAAGNPSVVAITHFDASGRELATAGSPRGVAPAAVELMAPGGGALGTLAVSVTDARRLAASAARRTGQRVAVLRRGRAVANTGPALPTGSGSLRASGRTYRGRRAAVGRTAGVSEEITVLRDVTDAGAATTRRRWLFAGMLLCLLLVALAASVAVSRALHTQIQQFLKAARRLARGRFDQPVSTKGNDEFAQLGREFNSMSDQLEAKMGEVERKRAELQETIQRVGKAFATGLDRQNVFELMVQTAVDACEADFGRGLPLDGQLLTEVVAGSDPGCRRAVEAAEKAAVAVRPETGEELMQIQLEGGTPAEQRDPAAGEHGGVYTLSLPVRARLGRRTHATYIAVISIARQSHPFTAEEAELLAYLAGQAVVSIENADLHETVRRQAVTDELTGLSNVREMHGALDREFERGRRHDTPVGFVLLDIDNFKRVNDTYGHQQGDEVLQAVSRVVREASRDIDEPARYGGEELAVVLPQTDMDGAARMAERVRAGIERLRIPLLGEPGHMGVTASVGVASVPSSTPAKAELIAAADAALYRAKRAGKNRVERAGSAVAGV